MQITIKGHQVEVTPALHEYALGKFERLTRHFVHIGPAEIADRAEIDEADLQLVGGGCVHRGCGECQGRRRGGHQKFFHVQLQLNVTSGIAYRSGTKTTPSEAGATEPALPRAREMMTRTITVAR